MINPWKVLNVHRKSTDEEIRDAYIVLAKKHHPDKKKSNVDKFHAANQSYNLLKDKGRRQELIDRLTVTAKPCTDCATTGVEYKSRGFTVKEYIKCTTCCGAGFLIREDQENVTIELRGTTGTGSKGRNNKRRS